MLRAAFLSIMFCLACLSVPGRAAADPLVEIYPDSVIAGHNTTFTLEVRVSSDITSLLGYDIEVTFDPAVLQLQSVDEGSLPLTSGYTTFFYWLNPAASGSVHVNGAVLGHTVDGAGTLFTLTFKGWAPVGVMTSDVIVSFADIRDGVNQPIAHGIKNGWVLVEPPVAVQTSTWGAVKSLFR